MEPGDRVPGTPPGGGGWRRAAALLGVVFAASVLRPGVLVAVPLLALLGRHGLRTVRVAIAAAVATVIVASGARDGVWYAERAWAVLVGGAFLGLTMLVPAWAVSSRALGAVLGAVAVSAIVLAQRTDAWAALDTAISDNIRAGVATTLDAIGALGGGGPASPAITSALYEVADAQAAVFPALVCLGSMAALGVAWWASSRLVGEGDQGLGPLAHFRFNDHLVWLFVAGMLLLVVQWGEALARVGANAVVFMGALYALRGAAVFVFVSGGPSLLGYLAFVVGLVLAAPILIGMAMVVGIGDTWLDIRARIRASAA
jgi:hypothetical protein